MKRFFCVFLVLLTLPVFSLADLPDISGLSYAELVQLKDQINLAIWNSKEWKCIQVPPGVYKIGVDIPAGHWTLKPPEGSCCFIEYFMEADATGKHPLDSLSNYYYEMLASETYENSSFIPFRDVDIDMKEGFYFSVSMGDYVLFEPYVSKSLFSFSD